LSPEALRDLWHEQAEIRRQRFDLEQAVDRVERTLQTNTRDLADTVQRLEGSRRRIDLGQEQLDGFSGPWSRFRNRDTINTLHRDIDHASGWVDEYEARVAALRVEIAQLIGERDRAIAHRDEKGPVLVGRTREIRSVLDFDASRRTAGMTQTPAYLSGLRRDGVDGASWRTIVGEIEQYRAAYGIAGNYPLGGRPSYDDITRVDRYRLLEQDLNQLAPSRSRNNAIYNGIER
jgi:hypothetical protein